MSSSCLKPAISLVAVLSSFSVIAAEAEATLGNVVVTATRQAQRVDNLLADVGVIDRNELDQAGAATIGDILARQPGVEISNTGGQGSSTNIYIRGTNGNHTVVLIDGQRVGSATLGTINWSRLPVSEIDHIEILRGPASSLYGSEAIGGVIQIFTRRGEGKPTIRAEAGLGSQGTSTANTGLSGSSGNFRYNLGVSTYRTDGISSIANPASKAYNPDKDGFWDDSMSGSLAYELATGHEIGVNFLDSKGRNRYDSGTSVSTAAKDYASLGHLNNVGIHLKNAFSEHWTSTLRFGRSEDESTSYTNNAISSIFNTHQDQISWQNDINLPLGTAMLAVERLDQRISGTSTFTVSSRQIDSLLAGWGGDFGSHRVQANLRRDENSQFGDKNTGNFAYGYRIDPAWSIHAAMGTAFKAPTFNDLYYPLSFGYVGNPNLKPEFARNKEIALNYRQNGQVASATYYVNRIQDLISWSGLTSPINIGEARLEGLTLAYAGTLAGFDVSSSIDLQDPKNSTTDHLLARRAKSHGTFSVGRNQGDWDWHAEFQTTGIRYDTDYSASNLNPRKMGGYSLVNLYGSYMIAPEWSVFARINNLFDRKYEQAADYGTLGANIFVGIRYQMK